MALRSVTEHPKFVKLKIALGKNKAETLGYLEVFWHFAGKFAPRGDVGRFTDREIETWAEWGGKPGALIRALVRTGWADRDSEYRLLVHDWSEHADQATKKALKRSDRAFVEPSRTPRSRPRRVEVASESSQVDPKYSKVGESSAHGTSVYATSPDAESTGYAGKRPDSGGQRPDSGGLPGPGPGPGTGPGTDPEAVEEKETLGGPGNGTGDHARGAPELQASPETIPETEAPPDANDTGVITPILQTWNRVAEKIPIEPVEAEQLSAKDARALLEIAREGNTSKVCYAIEQLPRQPWTWEVGPGGSRASPRPVTLHWVISKSEHWAAIARRDHEPRSAVSG